ncbi:MAG: bifunctional riboflavin kinase/FAD synthetase [Thiolinea sp.]
MKLLRYPDLSADHPEGCVATIGNFDGVHLAHQKIISHVQAKSKELGLSDCVISFEPLPGEYFSQPPVPRIYPLRDKHNHLSALGVDQFVCLRFDAEFAQQEAEAFIHETLLQRLKVRYLVVGDDFRFGRGRRGDYAMLREIGRQHGMEVSDTPTLLWEGQRVSSTLIRQFLQQGDLNKASTLLGRPYQLSGRIRHGDKRGRTIGFPTLNLRMPDNLALHVGVYAVKVSGLGGTVHRGVANLGKRPTVAGTEMRLEVHMFDFDDQVYGQYISVEPVSFIRPERKFDSFEQLKEQIQIDAGLARTILAENFS